MNWRRQAIAAYQRGDREEAARAFAQALKAEPGGNVARDLAIVYCELGRFDGAIDVLRPFLAQNPSDVTAWCALSKALLEQNRSADALAAAREAIALAPANWVALLALGNAQTDLGDFAEAAQTLAAAKDAAPEEPEPLVNLSALYARMQRVDEAIAAAEAAVALAPGDVAAHVNLAVAWLLRGDYERGFAEYEWRTSDPALAAVYNRPPLPRWDGSPMLDGALLVSLEQGIGDFICFSRFLRDARERVGRIVCELPEPLVELYRGFAGIDEIVAGRRLAGERADAFVPIASLPWVLKTLPNVVPSVPYLSADPTRVESYRKRFASFGKRRTVGLVWSGSAAYRLDRHRSLPIAALAGLGGFDDVAWISLQKGPSEDGLDAVSFPIHRFGSTLATFADTAAAVEALDLIITVDTSVAHLAGALGKPVWTMIGSVQHWLWQLHRNDSPWYPSMRLFRQRAPGRWGDVVTELASALS